MIFFGHLDAVDSNNKFNKLGEKKMLRKIFCCLFGSAKPVTQPMENLAEKPEAGQVVVQSNDPILAQIQLFALDFAPVGWLMCDGRQLAITQYMVLFALLGTKYGGDGKMSFALPDLRDKAPMPNMVYCLCVSGVFPERGGS